MAISRQSLILVLLLNAVVSAALVAVGVLTLAPKPVGRTPANTGDLEEAVSRLEDRNKALSARIGELQTRLGAQDGQIARLGSKLDGIERRGRQKAAAAGSGSSEKKGEKTRRQEDALAKAFGAMVRMQVQRQRGQFIRDILNPTPDSIAREHRQVLQMAKRISNALGLDAQDATEVGKILTEVDEHRRDAFRRLFEGRSNPAEATYPEVKQILDDSFAEEDRLVEQSFPTDTAKAYGKTSKPFRDFAYGLAKAAFPAPKTSPGK